MDVSKLKVTELKDELDKRGIATTKSMKKKDLSDLLEEAIGKDASAEVPTPPTTSEPTPAPAPAPTEPEVAAAEEAPFPPVFSEDETPVAKTAEQIEQTEKEERAGAGEGAAEGAQMAGIAMSAVEPEEEKTDGKEDVGVETEDVQNEERTDSLKRPLEDGAADGGEPKSDEAPIKRARVSSVPLSAYPTNFIPSSHPPTRALYVTNLRRPLADGTLDDHLSSFGTLDTSASVGKEACGWWLSPVKSHAFVVYTTLEAAVGAYTALQGCTTFPEEPAQGKEVPALKVTFLPPGPIPGLIKQEVKAWTEEGRKKLELLVEQVDGEWELKYKGAGDVNLGRGGIGGQSAMAVGGGGYAQGGQAAPPPRAFGGGSAPFGGANSYSRPSNGFSNPGFPPSNGFRRPPAGPPSLSGSAPIGSFDRNGAGPGYSRPRPPHESSSANGGYSNAPRAPYGPPPGRYERERDGPSRTTEAHPRLSWAERGGNDARGGGRDDRDKERDRDYRPRERDPRVDRDRDRRDDYGSRDRDRRSRSPYGDRRKDH